MDTSDNLENIYCFRSSVPLIDTSKHFEISKESELLRVKNKNINCLFSNLTAESFDKIYNEFNQHLNLDFEPMKFEGKVYSFTPHEQQTLIDTIITSWIYFYTSNDLPVEVKASDFNHPYMIDYVLGIMDSKYGEDTLESLCLGAKILRQDSYDYSMGVEARRQYYNR